MAGSVGDDFSRLDFQVLSTEQLLPRCLAQEHQRVWQQSVQVDQVQCSALTGKGGSFGRHCWGCKTDLELEGEMGITPKW